MIRSTVFVALLSLSASPSFAAHPWLLQDGAVDAPPQVDAAEADDAATLEDVTEEVIEEALEVEAPAGPRTTTAADWMQWERMGSASASPDGRWIGYTIRRNDGTSEMRLRVVATDATEVFEEGGSAYFSKDNKWMAVLLGHSSSAREAASKSKKTLKNKLALFDLVQGKTTEIEGVRNFGFSEDGAFIAMEQYGAKGDKNGSDLVIRELATGSDAHYGRVGRFTWADQGAWIAMTIDAPEQAGNGLRVVNAATGTMRTLDSAKADYLGMRWRKNSADLAVMRKTTYEDDEDATFAVLAFKDVSADEPGRTEYDHLEDEDFPESLRVVEFDGLSWSDDGDALFFGLKEWKDKPADLEPEEDEEGGDESADGEAEKADSEKPLSAPEDGDEAEEEADKKPAPKSLRDSLKEAPGVEIWHAKDIAIIPRQKLTASSDERDTIAAALWLKDSQLVVLENELVEDVTVLEGARRGVGFDETPYEEEQRFSATYSDLYSVDATNGEHKKLLDRVKYVLPGHPTGEYVLFTRDGHVWSLNMDSGDSVCLTKDTETAFINQEQSTLTDEKPPYGVAGWTEDGGQVLLYDRYDIYRFALDGGDSARLTNGAEDSIRYRRTRVEPDRDLDEFINLKDGFYASAYGDRTKESGYAHVTGSDVTTLVWKDAQISQLQKAEDADVFSFVEEDFDDSPDLFVAGPKMEDPKEVSDTNAFSDEFLWGKSELVDYESAGGEALQGALFYPADYDPAKTYPMVVYIYELRSQSLHQYPVPSERNPYSPAVFTQEGYFVFQPDIVYRDQNPGLSAVDCVVPAVRKVLESGHVDKDRVGLFGHSWGAYQTTFIVTQTDLFSAGVAGAPLTNMMSMSMSIYWNSGQTDAYIFHESQGRMDRPFWNDVDTYIANSPIFSIDDLNTPLLVAFGDNDGAVDWQQGIEMYNAARLAQRPFVMLVYPGENHSLRKKPNQVDYHYRVREWFDTHLRGHEAPKWISEGESWLDQKEELESIGKDDK